jgi:hypothetical protein
MDIKKLDLKKTLVAGSALAVVSAFVPQTVGTAVAGVVTMDVDVQIVTAVTLATPTDLDFGRIAKSGVLSGTHVLDHDGTNSTTATNGTVVVAGTAGGFQITGGQSAGNVQVTAGAAISYDGGNVTLDQLYIGGAGITGTITVAAGATASGTFSGGSADVDVGGRLSFSGTPANGNFNTGSISITINDIP